MTEVTECIDCGKPKSEERRQSLTRGRCRACYQRQVYALKKSGAFAAITPAAAQERLLSRGIAGRNGCIIWTGTVHPVTNYGLISDGGKTRYAHRVIYELVKGAIPAGLVVDHACHNRDLDCPGGNCIHHRCINPHHLDAVTHSENRLRSPHTKTSANGQKTHCKHGHEFTPENTMVIGSTGTRVCLACHRRRQREYTARKRAAA
jgi:hypothetical protein